MPSCQSLKDDALLAESYYDNVHPWLLLETPATEANINRFMKKYFPLRGTEAPRDVENLRDLSKEFLLQWTPRVQQIIKAAGGNPDIFAYSGLRDLQTALGTTRVSSTQAKKTYRRAQPSNVPILQETDKYIIYQPLTWEASRKYFGVERVSLLDGRQKNGSEWCTAASSPIHFDQYVNTYRDRLLYFTRKRDDELFAARSRGEPFKNEALWHSWYEAQDTVCGVGSARRGLQQFKGATQEKDHIKMIALNHFFHYHLQCLAPGGYVKECRDQKNKEIEMITLYQSLIDVNLFDPKIADEIPTITEDYIKFVALVVFGKKI